jgi:uncharacterized membrane protein (DUF2068 family)
VRHTIHRYPIIKVASAPFQHANSDRKKTLHAIALFEAVKGIAVLTASLGLLSLAHHGHLVQHTTTINGVLLVGNLMVVAYMLHRLWRRK